MKDLDKKAPSSEKWHRLPFTLIELMVVISIIAILASLLLPAMNMAREKARSILCLSNQKQCSLSMQMYANDFQTHYVVRLDSTTRLWSVVLSNNDYMKNSKAVFCPSMHTFTNVNNTYSMLANLSQANLMDFYKSNSTTGNNYIIFFSSKIKRPESFPLFFDGYRFYASDPKPLYIGTFDNNDTLSYFHVRHGNYGNIGYADGHAASQSKEGWAANINDSIIIPYSLQSYYAIGIWYMKMSKIPARVLFP